MQANARRLLKQAYGPTAEFRDGQWEAVEALVVRRRRVLVVQRTGWGKSLVYFLATRLMRDKGMGPTLIVSPLLSLMRNQLEAADRLGLTAATINSTNTDHWDQIKTSLRDNLVDLLLVSPEQLGGDHFAAEVLPLIPGAIGMLVVDEAHCISDWGHDFRPDYRRIIRIIQQLPPNIPVLGTTATANDRVVNDVSEQLGPDLEVHRGPLVRESLRLQAIRLADQAERLAWLAEQLPRLPGAGIIYCLTVADCDRVSAWLQQHGFDAPAYHSRSENRETLEHQLLANGCKALVATVALGMGFDKPDLGFVIHYQRPGSVVAYYQQVGRAGRAVDDAYAILLNGKEDDEIQEYFINAAFPTEEATEAVVRTLERTGGMQKDALLHEVNLGKGQVDRILKLLILDGVVGKDRSIYFRTLNPFRRNRPEQEQITQLRRHELARMKQFVTNLGCLMEFIERELDDPFAAPCGRCANCAGDAVPRSVRPELVRAAITFLRRDHQVISPRRAWPAHGYGGRKGRIPPERQVEPGRALCMWGDAGWGTMVKTGKNTMQHFPDELVEAIAEMIERDWHPSPAPEWVTAVPSRRHPTLVPDYAQRLAVRLGLPFLPVQIGRASCRGRV